METSKLEYCTSIVRSFIEGTITNDEFSIKCSNGMFDIKSNENNPFFGKLFDNNCKLLMSAKRNDKYIYTYDPRLLINIYKKYSGYELLNSVSESVFDLERREKCCNCISISLYLNHIENVSDYMENILITVGFVEKFLPTWIVRLYFDISIYKLLISHDDKNPKYVMLKDALEKLYVSENVEIYNFICEKDIQHKKRIQRFDVLYDPTVNVSAIREADGSVTLADINLLLAFMESPTVLYITPFASDPEPECKNGEPYSSWLRQYVFHDNYFRHYDLLYNMFAGAINTKLRVKKSVFQKSVEYLNNGFKFVDSEIFEDYLSDNILPTKGEEIYNILTRVRETISLFNFSDFSLDGIEKARNEKVIIQQGYDECLLSDIFKPFISLKKNSNEKSPLLSLLFNYHLNNDIDTYLVKENPEKDKIYCFSVSTHNKLYNYIDLYTVIYKICKINSINFYDYEEKYVENNKNLINEIIFGILLTLKYNKGNLFSNNIYFTQSNNLNLKYNKDSKSLFVYNLLMYLFNIRPIPIKYDLLNGTYKFETIVSILKKLFSAVIKYKTIDYLNIPNFHLNNNMDLISFDIVSVKSSNKLYKFKILSEINKNLSSEYKIIFERPDKFINTDYLILPYYSEYIEKYIIPVKYNVDHEGELIYREFGNDIRYFGKVNDKDCFVNVKKVNIIKSDKIYPIILELKHKNIISLYGLSVPKENSNVGIVTEFMPYSFEDILSKLITDVIPENLRQFTDPILRLQMVLDLCDGLKYLHENKIYHTNIKPNNIAIDLTNKSVKITDLAHILPDDMAKVTGMRGSPIYMCPALAKNTVNVSDKTDIYSLGITIWQVLTLIVPYKNFVILSRDDFFNKVSEGKRPCSEMELNSLKPAGIGALIRDCWNGIPSLRPDITTVISRLTRIIDPAAIRPLASGGDYKEKYLIYKRIIHNKLIKKKSSI